MKTIIRYVNACVAAVAVALACSGCIENTATKTADSGQRADTFYNTPGSADAEGNRYDSSGNASLLDVVIPPRLDNEVVHYKAMTVYFNRKYRQPNCVAYELTNTAVAMADAPDAEKRSNYNFNRDPKVDGCPEWWEYKESGYDRGHMTPAMDMRWDKTAMEECFLMTNICPQDHGLNDGEWRVMEEAIHRKWANKYGRLVIVTGPIFADDMPTFGKKGIAVPPRFFKVVYAPDQNYSVAFVFDNRDDGQSWRKHAVSVDEVERLTGYNFFAALDDERETKAERQNEIDKWPNYVDNRR